MRKLVFVGLLCLGLGQLNAQTNQANTTNETKQPKVVINYKMIEKFNAAEYSETEISWRSLVNEYSFEDVQLLYHAYHNSDLELSTFEEVNQTLAEIKDKMKTDDWKHKSPQKLITEITH